MAGHELTDVKRLSDRVLIHEVQYQRAHVLTRGEVRAADLKWLKRLETEARRRKLL
jgi:hypothetical protein